jgi:nucleoside-diphosphate-sugar epimerase
MTPLLPLALVTGADGFVGRYITAALMQAGWRVRRAIRSTPESASNGDVFTGLELTPWTRWQTALEGVQAVVHTAARAHLSTRVQKSEQDLYMSVNVDGTRRLARSAIDAGVRDFVFLSSIAVNGSTTDGRAPFTEHDIAAPTTVYGHSKAAAEDRLAELSASSAMRVTAIRPPMIYGSGARGNFRLLTAAVNAGIPLPFGRIRNRRAFLSVENLTSFITHRLNEASKSKFDVFLLADDAQVSTPEFIRMLGTAWTKKARIVRFPVPLLRIGLAPFHLGDALIGNLEVDTSKSRAGGWRPKVTLAEGLLNSAQAVEVGFR